MAIEGALSDVSLADISQLLAMGRKTGCLSLTDQGNFGYIYFEDGRVVYASVVDRPDRLGELLVKNEVIDRDQLSAAMEKQAHERGKKLGKLLATRSQFLDYDSALQWSESAIPLVGLSADHKEGVAAFREKRDANFQGF